MQYLPSENDGDGGARVANIFIISMKQLFLVQRVTLCWTSYDVLLACTFNGAVLTPLTVDMRYADTTVDIGQQAHTNYLVYQYCTKPSYMVMPLSAAGSFSWLLRKHSFPYQCHQAAS